MNYFFKILDSSDPLFCDTISSMRSVLVPLYGVEAIDLLIKKIEVGKDRSCEIYFQEGTLRGMIVYKNFLSSEFEQYGIRNGFEEKTTLPLPSPDKSAMRVSERIMIMRRLLNRAAQNAISMKAECFFGTVSEEKTGTLKLLLNLGFEVAHVFKDKFKSNVDEYLIVHKNLKNLYELTKKESFA